MRLDVIFYSLVFVREQHKLVVFASCGLFTRCENMNAVVQSLVALEASRGAEIDAGTRVQKRFGLSRCHCCPTISRPLRSPLSTLLFTTPPPSDTRTQRPRTMSQKGNYPAPPKYATARRLGPGDRAHVPLLSLRSHACAPAGTSTTSARPSRARSASSSRRSASSETSAASSSSASSSRPLPCCSAH